MSLSNDSNPHDRTEEFLQLYGRHDRAIYTYILALVPSWTDADDLAQETRLRLWHQFYKYKSGSDFEAWARSIVHYLVLTYRKRAARSRLRFKGEFLEAVAAEFTRTPNLLFSRQEALTQCVEKIDDQRRKLLEDCYVSGLTVREIAKRIGRSYDATRKAISRAQRWIADCVKLELARKERE